MRTISRSRTAFADLRVHSDSGLNDVTGFGPIPLNGCDATVLIEGWCSPQRIRG